MSFYRGLLASGGGTADRTIKFWNTSSGNILNSIDTGSQVCSLVWSRHQRELCSLHGYSENQLILWKYPSMTKIKELTGHTARVLNLEMSPDGSSIVSAGADETLRFWNIFDTLEDFEDAYCLQPSHDKLKSLNRSLKTYKNCAGIRYNGDGGSLPYSLINISESCSSLDSGLCVDSSAMKERRSHSFSNQFSLNRTALAGKFWVTKLKNATGGLLLLASFVMFTGILFTNRRRRPALLQRKYR